MCVAIVMKYALEHDSHSVRTADFANFISLPLIKRIILPNKENEIK